MSWMDSWSRPAKGQATPAPYYLIPGSEATPYCHSCGRVIGSRRTGNADATPVKYCSSRCQSRKPGKLDREIERAFVRFLNEDETLGVGEDIPSIGQPTNVTHKRNAKPGKDGKKLKGDARVLVSCDTVESYMFQRTDDDSDSDETGSGGSNHETEVTVASRSLSHDMDASNSNLEDPAAETEYIDGDKLARMSVRSGTRIRPPQSVSEVNGSVGGEKGRAERITETEEMLEKRRQGQRRAKEREMVRCAARRGVVFGFATEGMKIEGSPKMNRKGQKETSDDNDGRRKCEAVMLGKVVEPSFAKGDWSVRWRE